MLFDWGIENQAWIEIRTVRKRNAFETQKYLHNLCFYSNKYFHKSLVMCIFPSESCYMTAVES